MKWLESPDGVCRFSFIVKKKQGNAVYRNRCRRILRPVFFDAAPHLALPVWAVVYVKEDFSTMTSIALRDSANKLLSKLQKKLLDSMESA
jgi:ribonuclease P protein component